MRLHTRGAFVAAEVAAGFDFSTQEKEKFCRIYLRAGHDILSAPRYAHFMLRLHAEAFAAQ